MRGEVGAQARVTAIYELVDAIPVGRVMTYGDVARELGIPSARVVGRAMAHADSSVPWHRVVLASGCVAPHLANRQLALLASEGTPTRGDKVDLAAARWVPAGG